MTTRIFQCADMEGKAPAGTCSKKYLLRLFDHGLSLLSLNSSSFRIVLFGKQNVTLQNSIVICHPSIPNGSLFNKTKHNCL